MLLIRGWKDICALHPFIEYRGGDVNSESLATGNITYDEHCCDTCARIAVLISWFVFQSCIGNCEANRACVQCRMFGTGELVGEECSRKCKDFKITAVDKLTPGKQS